MINPRPASYKDVVTKVDAQEGELQASITNDMLEDESYSERQDKVTAALAGRIPSYFGSTEFFQLRANDSIEPVLDIADRFASAGIDDALDYLSYAESAIKALDYKGELDSKLEETKQSVFSALAAKEVDNYGRAEAEQAYREVEQAYENELAALSVGECEIAIPHTSVDDDEEEEERRATYSYW